MGEKRKPRRGHKTSTGGQGLDRDKIAAALALEVTQGAAAAAEAFGISVRSVRRYKAQMAKEPGSDLAASVRQAKRRALQRADDLLTQTWEAILLRMQQLLPDATFGQVNKAASTIGELRISREALGIDDNVGIGDRGEGHAAQEDSGRATGGEEGTQPDNVRELRRPA